MDNEKFQEVVLQQLNKVFEKLGSMENRLGAVEQGQLRLELRLENEVINQISALFDGFELQGDQIENLKKHLDQRFESIEIDTGYLVSKVAKLEKMAK